MLASFCLAFLSTSSIPSGEPTWLGRSKLSDGIYLIWKFVVVSTGLRQPHTDESNTEVPVGDVFSQQILYQNRLARRCALDRALWDASLPSNVSFNVPVRDSATINQPGTSSHKHRRDVGELRTLYQVDVHMSITSMSRPRVYARKKRSSLGSPIPPPARHSSLLWGEVGYWSVLTEQTCVTR